jgi:hypothetical protein
MQHFLQLLVQHQRIAKTVYPTVLKTKNLIHGNLFKIMSILSSWRETSQSLGTLIVDQPTNLRPIAEELKFSRDRARRRQCPTNNLLEVWQNSAIFSGRLIGGAVEALLTKVVNW